MKSDLHETFSVFHDWSPELINNVHVHARARVHAQQLEMCMQLGAKNKPSYFREMKSDLYETWDDVQGSIKQAPCLGPICACMHMQRT